jgi:DNA-directed RNA polymerase subunit omega
MTVDDCLEKLGNRFDLVLLAALRAQHLSNHAQPLLVSPEGSKPPVLALLEIAEGKIDFSYFDKAGVSGS